MLQFVLEHFKCPEILAVNQSLRFSYIYCRRQRKKRATNRRNDKGTSQSSNQELNNEDTLSINQVLEYTEETIPNIKELNLRETILSDQQLENNELISSDSESKMNSETSQRDEEIDENKAVQSDKELRGSKANLRNKEFVNTEGFSRNQELTLSETFPSYEDSENPERFPNNQELKLRETVVYSNQDFDKIDTISSKQVLEDPKTVTSNLDQQLENREAISSHREFESTEAPPGNDFLENTEVLPTIKYE